MADYQTLTYIMYKEKEHQLLEEEKRIKREEEERKRQEEAARRADEQKAQGGPTNIREIIKRQQERAKGIKSEENKPTPPPTQPRVPNISISDLEEFFEEEM